MSKQPHKDYALDRIVGLLGLATIALMLAVFVSPAFALEPVADTAIEQEQEQEQEQEREQTEDIFMAMLVSPRLANTGTLNALRSEARRQLAVSAQDQSENPEPGKLEIDIEPDATPEVVEDAIETRCLPLVKLSDDDAARKLFFGIGFDGVVGIHGNL